MSSSWWRLVWLGNIDNSNGEGQVLKSLPCVTNLNVSLGVHYYNSWIWKRSKFSNKSFFISGHVHFDYNLEAWMKCVFFTNKFV